MGLFKKQLKNGQFQYYMDLRDHTGRRFIRSLKTDSLPIAKQRYHEMSLQILGGETTAKSGYAMADLINDFLAYKDGRVVHSTWEVYQSALTALTSVIPPNTPLLKITPNMADQIQENLRNRLRDSSVNTYMTCYKSTWNWALLRERAIQNPFIKITRLKTSTKVSDLIPPIFTQEQYKHVINTLTSLTKNGPQYAQIAQLAKETGLRVSEACRVRYDQITSRHIEIIFENKSQRPRRIPLSQEAKDVIQKVDSQGIPFHQ